MDDEPYFTVEGHEWTPKYYFKLPNIEPPENMTKIAKLKFPKKVFFMAGHKRAWSQRSCLF